MLEQPMLPQDERISRGSDPRIALLEARIAALEQENSQLHIALATARSPERVTQELTATSAKTNQSLLQPDRLLAVVAPITQDLEAEPIETAIPAALRAVGEAANSGAALHRQQLIDRLVAERMRTEQERTVELLKANEVLTNTLDRLAREPDPNAFLGYLMLEIARQVAACKVHVFLYDAATNTLEQQVCVQDEHIYQPYAPHDPLLFRAPFAADITPAWQFLIEQQEIIITTGEQATEMHWQETIAWHRTQGHSLRAILALMAGEQPVGLLALAFRDRQSLQQAELDLLRALANQATLAIQLAQSAEEAKQAAIAREQEKAAQQRAAELAKANQVLKQSLDALAAEPTLISFLGHVLTSVTQQLQASSATLWKYEPDCLARLLLIFDGRTIQPAEQTDHPYAHCPQDYSGSKQTQWEELINQRHAELVTVAEAHLDSSQRDYLLRQGVWGILSVPMVLGDRTLGTFAVHFSAPCAFQHEQLELVQALANQAALAIELTYLVEEAKQVAVLEERNRMARDIHDTLAQAFTGVIVHLGAASRLIDDQLTLIQRHIHQAQQLAREGLAEARRSVSALRPQVLEDGDLYDAFSRLSVQMSSANLIQVTCSVMHARYPLSAEVENNLFRIGQEALTNAIKHSGASTIQIDLCYAPSQFVLSIRDNGQGFDPEQQPSQGGYGLMGMQERSDRIHAQLVVESRLGRGTEVKISVNREDV